MVSRCMEDGHWTPVEVQCSLPSVASTWSIVTISVLAVVILLLLSALLWLFGHDRLGKMIQKKPSLTSQGVSTKTLEISHLQSPFNSPLTNTLPSFYKTYERVHYVRDVTNSLFIQLWPSAAISRPRHQQ